MQNICIVLWHCTIWTDQNNTLVEPCIVNALLIWSEMNSVHAAPIKRPASLVDSCLEMLLLLANFSTFWHERLWWFLQKIMCWILNLLMTTWSKYIKVCTRFLINGKEVSIHFFPVVSRFIISNSNPLLIRCI